MEIEHLCGEASHGPVSVFLTDSGRIGFVCPRDGAYWEGDMPQLRAADPELKPAGGDVSGPDLGSDAADGGGSGELGGASPWRRPSGSLRGARQPMSRKEAFQVARHHLT